MLVNTGYLRWVLNTACTQRVLFPQVQCLSAHELHWRWGQTLQSQLPSFWYLHRYRCWPQCAGSRAERTLNSGCPSVFTIVETTLCWKPVQYTHWKPTNHRVKLSPESLWNGRGAQIRWFSALLQGARSVFEHETVTLRDHFLNTDKS